MDLRQHQLAGLLRCGAAGIACEEAAVELLAGDGYWLGHHEFVRRHLTTALLADGRQAAYIDWPGAIARLDSATQGGPPAKAALLRIAASLGGDVPVRLAAVLRGLDHVTLARIAQALIHANGPPQHDDSNGEPP